MELSNTELHDGPLSQYRAQATFDWRELKVFLEGEESIRFKDHIYETLSRDALFHRDWRSLSLKESREINHRRWKRIQQYAFVNNHPLGSNMDRVYDLFSVLEAYDQGLSARHSLSSVVFFSSVLAMGTERHLPVLEQCLNNEIVGCFCLTELSHGSNTKNIRTECRFDNGAFILHTPDQQAMKCWAGNLSHSATHAVVFAQLYTEGVCRGVHAFCVQIRDLSTMRPLPRITIGDMGEKPGAWNGVENGWMRFNSYRIPLSALLNKFANVSSDGKYTTSSKNKREQQSASLGALAVGRVGIVGKGALAAQLASVIAIRYSAVRKQFGPKGRDELPILEYPMQQHRIFPMLATAIALSVFHRKFHRLFYEYLFIAVAGDKSNEVAAMSREIHALSSATKPIATSAGVECLSEARLACGGHGFLKCSRLNDLRDAFDPSQTFEGENNVLLQQAFNVILSILDERSPPPDTPLGSLAFLKRPPRAFTTWHDDIITEVHTADCDKFIGGNSEFFPYWDVAALVPRIGNVDNPVITVPALKKTERFSTPIAYQFLGVNVESAYEWLVFYLASESREKNHCNQSMGMDRFGPRNNAHYDYCRSLAIAYGELTIISWFHQAVLHSPLSLRNVLVVLSTIYALSTLEKHIATLYIGGYCSGAEWGKKMRESLFKAELALKHDAVAICDAIAPPDFVLHSALGMSDGRVYEHLSEEFERNITPPPLWCNELSAFLSKSKL